MDWFHFTISFEEWFIFCSFLDEQFSLCSVDIYLFTSHPQPWYIARFKNYVFKFENITVETENKTAEYVGISRIVD